MMKVETMDRIEDDRQAELIARVRGYVGVGGTREGFASRGPVSARVVRQMTDVLGDLNPIYTDDAAAKANGHPGIVAPPTMLHAWTLPGLEASEGQELRDGYGTRRFRQTPYGERVKAAERRTLRDEVNDVFAEYGYASPAVTNMWFEYHRYVRPGDQLLFSSWVVEDIVGPKQTGLGEGYFVTIRLTVTDTDGRSVGTIRQRYLRSRPRAKAADAVGVKERAAPVGTPGTEGDWQAIMPSVPLAPPAPDTVAVGGLLAPLLIDVTPTLVIGGALASQDFQDVHHDAAAARRRGHPDVYMNILTSTGLVGRYITDWAGPRALIRSLSIKLGRPNYPGDQVAMKGEVTSVESAEAGRRIVVRVTGDNRLGNHVTSEVVLDLPRDAA